MAKGKHAKEPDNKQKKKMQLINAAVTAAVFVGITVSLIVLERPVKSETEKRSLAEFPDFTFEDFISGKYTAGVSNWFNDTVPWRDGFKDISANITKHMGISLGGVKLVGTPTTVVTEATTAAPATAPTTETAAPSASENTGTEETREITPTQTEAATEPPYDPRNEIAPGVQSNGILIVEQKGHWRAINLYGGGFARDRFVEQVNAFAEDLDGFANVYVMTVPTCGEYYTPANYAEYNASQSEDISYMAEHFSDKVTNVDCLKVLEQHLEEEIYARTDYHWMPLGAYYTAGEFAKAAGIEFPDLETYDKREREGFVGSWYGNTGEAVLLNDPEVFTYYIPANDFSCYYYDTAYNYDGKYPFFVQQEKDLYSTFMGGDAKIVRIETDVKNGRRLLVFKDSYGNAEIPFYMNGYEEIYVCDIRFFDLNAVEFIKENEIDDLLFTMCTFSAGGDNSKYLEVIRTR